MARNQEDVVVAPGDWVELTNANTASMAWQVKTGLVEIAFTENASPPGASIRGQFWAAPDGSPEGSLTDKNTHLAAPVRVWARAAGSGQALVWVDSQDA